MTEKQAETDEFEERAESYSSFRFERLLQYLPVDQWPHPFNALKAHSLQFGGLLGLGLGVLAASNAHLSVSTGAVSVAVGSVALSAVLYLYLLKRVMDFLEVGEEPTSIAMYQIREKPHYFGSALAALWILAGLVAAWLL